MSVKPKKHFGQHFLTDKNIAEKIIRLLEPFNVQNILEVGPGRGILTDFLIKIPDVNFKCVEIDHETVDFLISDFGIDQNKIIHEDFLLLDLNEHFTGDVAVIGNFPYNISSQILFQILHFRSIVPIMAGMFQKEVAERIVAPPGSKIYGILSVMTQSYYNAEMIFTVNEHVFFPPPKVKSTVIRLVRKTQSEFPEVDYSLLSRIVRTAFGQRRKMLRNSLASFRISDIFDLSEFLNKRPEQISVIDFHRIAAAIKENNV